MSNVKNMTEFEEICKLAIVNERGVIVLISMPDLFDAEEIHNTAANVPKKLEYYKQTYGEGLRMKRNMDISIVGCYIK
ncbi:hypothetical protein [Psychrobacillus sp. BM2]|uniref:hypothetical protein n=1 Tax=Psychrobacillus sp. BM2 TaxID=3400421 RepID=UPI003B02DA1D